MREKKRDGEGERCVQREGKGKGEGHGWREGRRHILGWKQRGEIGVREKNVE